MFQRYRRRGGDCRPVTRCFLFLALIVMSATIPLGARCSDDKPFPPECYDPLEDEFFDLMWLCDSPVESERDAAQEELARRFDEFEPVWKDRTFLTDGEVADESRRRFERAEKDFWNARLERARTAFDVKLDVEPPEGEGAEAVRRANVRVSWRVPLRVVWLAPDFRSFLWRDPETNRLWRPRSLYSAPELQPEFDSEQVELDFFLEPVPDDALPPEDASVSEFAFDALVGVDPVAISIPLSDDGEPREYRVGELTLRVPPVKRDDKGGLTVSLCLDYDSAFDAFDSHRSWREPDDFLLAFPKAAARVRPASIRGRDRNPNGERLEFFFAADPALDDALRKNAAALVCRFPRFFARLHVAP